MIRSTVVWLLLTVVAGTGLFVVKHEVQDLEERLAAIDDSIAKDRDAIHVLHAEWSYLIQPERLAALAARHLALKPPVPGQIADSVERLPLPAAPESAVPPADPKPHPPRPTLAKASAPAAAKHDGARTAP